MNEALLQSLKSKAMYEGDAQLAHREFLVQQLSEIIHEWIRNMAQKDDTVPDDVKSQVSGFVCTFGSVCLDVHHVESDMDVLCIGPRHVGRDLFFDLFPIRLRVQPRIRDVRVIQDAFVPVIKFEFDGINFDLVFAHLDLPTIPIEIDLMNEEIYKDIDPICARSMNGASLVAEILTVVGDVEQYRLALRTIKLWAKNNGIHSNVYGYFGGITWAIMLAFVAKHNPSLIACELVAEFFSVFHKWDWSNPVTLKPYTCSGGGGAQSLEQFGDLFDAVELPYIGGGNGSEEQNCMPVITPTHPQQNTTFNTCESSRKIIEEEIFYGYCCTLMILDGKLEWDALFQESSILGRYDHFLVVYVESDSTSHLKRWEGVVTSRMRILPAILDENANIDRSQILDYTLPLKQSMLSEGNSLGCVWLVGLSFKTPETDAASTSKESGIEFRVDLTNEVSLFIHTITNTMLVEDAERGKFACRHARRTELGKFVESDDLRCDRAEARSREFDRRLTESVRATLSDLVKLVADTILEQ